jgi:DNA-binding LacI/PurR family transcriptional regulator
VASTLKDVAAVARVTPTVVSHVLHNKVSTVRVSEATAERVRAAATELGYRVNVFARNFRERQTRTIGVLNGQGLILRPLFAKGPRYFATLMDGIVNGAFDHGISVTLCPQLLGEHPEESISDGRFDGLILYSIMPSEKMLKALDQCTVPIVIVHAHAKDFGNRYPTLIANNSEGVGLALDHLVELGHTKIAFATEPDDENVETRERLEAYKFHMEGHGLRWVASDIIQIDLPRESLHSYLNVKTLPHSAVIVHADGLAGEFVTQAQVHGHRVPQDLAVIGFDSTDYCNEIRPTLTSISQPLFDLGNLAARRLLQLGAGETPEPLELLLPCGLDIRGSTVAEF